ncbi:hypothetical protein ACHAWF_014531 [Thalassiosira exigua]
MDTKKYLSRNFQLTFWKTFDCIQAFAGKANHFRIAILYKQICSDAFPAKPFFANWDIGNGYVTKHRCVQTAIFGSKPKHPIVTRSMELTMKNTQSMNYEDNKPLEATGPCILGSADNGFRDRSALQYSVHSIRTCLFGEVNP